ncbi:MAG: glycerate kinase [Phycisphaeraceae bacterium]|nr:glycerate kinase [Phycisphaeraceae bacterium]
MLKVLCAPNAFKESLSVVEAAKAMARGVRNVVPDAQVDLCSIADGGDGTSEALVAAAGGQFRISIVHGPLGKPVEARWGLLPGEDASKRAVIEMAAASGLSLVPQDQRDPTRTTTFGTGQIIAAAIDEGVTEIILGIGGSATCDGGTGCAQALGVRFFDHAGKPLAHPLTGGELSSIARIDTAGRDPRLAAIRLRVACDVTNPLTGPHGAARTYGPQKGATPEQVERLDAGLAHLADRMRVDLGVDVMNLPGAGAAGGLGAGAVAFVGAQLLPGVDLVLDACRFDDRVAGCDLCLTGEGKLDGQTLAGKACLGVAKAAAKHGVPTYALVGAVGPGVDELLHHGLTGYRVIAPDLPARESMRRAAELLEAATSNLVREWLNER